MCPRSLAGGHPILRFAVIAALIPIALFGPRPALADKAKQKHSPRFLVVQQLQHGLAGTPLEPYAWALEREAHRWNVNPYLVASITGKESSFGAHRCGFNPFGWGSCRGVYFESFPDAIATVTAALRRNYMDAWGLRSVEAIGETYCQCGSDWAVDVTWFMRARFASAPKVTYPR